MSLVGRARRSSHSLSPRRWTSSHLKLEFFATRYLHERPTGFSHLGCRELAIIPVVHRLEWNMSKAWAKRIPMLRIMRVPTTAEIMLFFRRNSGKQGASKCRQMHSQSDSRTRKRFLSADGIEQHQAGPSEVPGWSKYVQAPAGYKAGLDRAIEKGPSNSPTEYGTKPP